MASGSRASTEMADIGAVYWESSTSSTEPQNKKMVKTSVDTHDTGLEHIGANYVPGNSDPDFSKLLRKTFKKLDTEDCITFIGGITILGIILSIGSLAVSPSAGKVIAFTGMVMTGAGMTSYGIGCGVQYYKENRKKAHPENLNQT